MCLGIAFTHYFVRFVRNFPSVLDVLIAECIVDEVVVVVREEYAALYALAYPVLMDNARRKVVRKAQIEHTRFACDAEVESVVFCDFFKFVFKQNDVVAVPSYAAGNVKSNLIVKSKQRGNFIADVFERVIMSVIEQTADIVFSRVVLIEFVTADGVTFDADAENLAFYRDNDFFLVVRFLSDFVKTFFKAKSRNKSVGGNVL